MQINALIIKNKKQTFSNMQIQPQNQSSNFLPPITFEDAFETQFSSYFTLKQTLAPPNIP